MKKLIILILLFSSALLTRSTSASIPRDTDSASVVRILARHTDEKFTALKEMGPAVYGVLRSLAFDEDRTLATRWQAFMAMARLGEKDSLPEVDRALLSHDWFLRDAALKVLPLLDQGKAYTEALKKLDDSALIVRTTAVDALAKIKNPDCSEKLWQQLYSKDNYIHHQSLWIRRHILEALADLAPLGSEERFIKVLSDNDSTLFPSAIRGLERITGKRLGAEQEPAVFKRHYWESWFKESRKTKT
jgi:HEAT repeat protein